MINIISRSKIYLGLSALMILGSALSLVFFGLRLGIDFTGGSLMEVEFFEQRPSNDQVKERLSGLGLGEFNLQPTGENGLILRLKDINEDAHQEVLGRIGMVEEKRFESVGPIIGQELKRKALWAIGLALAAIIIYIAWAFRKVSKPVASWQYGLVAIIALFHDVFITLGFFSVLGQVKQVEIGLPLVAAFLTILGYSVNNSIVIFDRARENLLKTDWKNFSETINQSVNQSISRCLNTALTTLFVLLAIFFLGGETIKYFSLALIIGIVVGTYSSIFITSPLIVLWQRKRS
ncbi:MAG: protein translocase subunit SecF [Candidatus Portnoybacteria bacterium]